MRPSGHRVIGALALLMVVLLGASVLVPLVAQGQTFNITGLVKICPSAGFVATATVTLTDMNGINPPRTTTTDTAGVYRFVQPPTGTYSIAANRSGYFNSDPSSPARFDGSRTVNLTVCMVPLPTPSKTLTVTVTGTGGSPVPGATVAAFSTVTGRLQLAASGTTNSTGVVILTLWAAVFSVRASATGLQTVESSIDVSTVSQTTISLVAPVELYGHVTDVDTGEFVGTGVVAWLFDPTEPVTSAFRLIPATVKDSLFEFETVRVLSPRTYTIIVDAKGYLAHKNTVSLTGTPTEYTVAALKAAPQERFDTTILYAAGAQDWNNVTIWRNITLNADSTLPGLVPPNLRDLRLQIDATFGDGNGDLTPLERDNFNASIAARGPGYVTTDLLLTTNRKAYNSSTANYAFTVVGLEKPGSKVWINGSTTYSLKQAPPFIKAGAKTYFLNMSLVPDANVTTYQNFTYTVSLPRTYERNMTTLVPANSAILTDFTRFTIDPGLVGGTQRVDAQMTVSQALNGTARAQVTAPPGKFYVENATFTKYRAFVANNTTLTFSAAASTDPNGLVTNATHNFTWRFTGSDTRYWMVTQYKYRQSGQYTVNVTMREPGGNLSYRNITLYVDDQLPVAKIRTNRTGSLSANGLTLKVDEGIVVRFDGGLSTDLAYLGNPDKDGKILDSGYLWDFGDGSAKQTGRTINKTFAKPGLFTVNLTVTDSVGWKGANATMTAQVNDTKPPVPAFDILDPSNDWTVITSPIEQKTIALNASKTTDDYDKIATLNFTWTIPGPITGEVSNTNHTKWGVNVSFAWLEWNNSYGVTLSVRDRGFRGTFDPTKENRGNLTRKINVQIDPLLHADLRIDAGTLKINPADPAEGDLVTISVNVTNKLGRATAGEVTTQVRSISGGQTTIVSSSADWFNKSGASKGADHTIPSGDTVKLVFTLRLAGQGNKTLQVYVADKTEPYTWITPENRASSPVNVRQPVWQPYAIAAAVIGVIVLFVFGMYARRKIKAGEWRPIRGRRGARGEGEEKKPRREVKEEKKRL